MLSEFISENIKASIVVLFGGSEVRRHEVVSAMMESGFTVYGTLSEEEGMEMVKNLPKVDAVVIGGRYDENQRLRIKQFMTKTKPNAMVTEPGRDYAYNMQSMVNQIKQRLAL